MYTYLQSALKEQRTAPLKDWNCEFKQTVSKLRNEILGTYIESIASGYSQLCDLVIDLVDDYFEWLQDINFGY